jgi:lipopolysaccharide transport system permease protein
MEEWFIEIKPRNKLLKVDLREIWKYRDLLKLYIKRDIITQYKQTILGPLWYLIQPAITTVFFMLIFGRLAKIPTDGLPQPIFYMAGIICWQYFSDCLNKTSNTFIANQDVFGKVYFPRLILPLSTVTSNLVRFGIQFLLFLLIYIVYFILGANISPNAYAFLIPVLILMLAGLSLGFGIIVSSMTTKYRDLTFLFAFIIQLWMYATPIIYPLSTMPSGKRWIMVLNPVTSIIETFKYGMLGVGTFSWYYLLYSFIFMLFILGTGVIVFNKVQKNFMDTV